MVSSIKLYIYFRNLIWKQILKLTVNPIHNAVYNTAYKEPKTLDVLNLLEHKCEFMKVINVISKGEDTKDRY